MQGEITVKSEVGHGSQFCLTFTFPIAGKVAMKPTSIHLLHPDHEEDREANQHFRVLIVEDYNANILVATALLTSFGYSFEIAHNGKEAVELLAKETFDLVLMDVQMPVMDGYRATRLIRKQEKAAGKPPIPIIGMTAHALTGDKEKCLRAGMNEYISKPFEPDELKEVLKSYGRRIAAQ